MRFRLTFDVSHVGTAQRVWRDDRWSTDEHLDQLFMRLVEGTDHGCDRRVIMGLHQRGISAMLSNRHTDIALVQNDFESVPRSADRVPTFV